MPSQTYTRFAKTLARYLQLEHPPAWAAVAQSDQASSAAAAIALAAFTRGSSIPNTAGDIARAVEQLASEEW